MIPAGRGLAGALGWLVAPAIAIGCVGASSDVAADSVVAQDSTEVPPAIRQADSSWVATPRGLGALRTGATVAEAWRALGEGTSAPDSLESCDHVAVPGAPGSVLAMIVDGHVARIEVKDDAIATDRGARVGDSEARVQQLYGERLSVQPHKYTDGHYLVVTPEAAADSAYRLIFETDGARVLEYRVGLLPSVGWVEGCS